MSIHSNQNQGSTATTRRARRKTAGARAVRGSHGWPRACSLVHVQEHPTANDAFSLDRTVQFIYDGWLLLAELNQQSKIANRKRVYLHGLDLSGTPEGAGGIGSMLAVTTTRSDSAISSSLLYLYDGNGNVAALVDPATAESVASYEYSPFGKTLVAHGPLAATNPFRFSAKYTDTETGLVYYGYRYYEPALGRWINRDPIGERGGLHLQLAMTNDLVSGWDILGARWVKVPGTRFMYRATRNGDTLRDLAIRVGRPASDSVCIWPTGSRKLWKRYPVARQCADAYVHNLLRESKKDVAFLGPVGARDRYMRTLQGFYNRNLRSPWRGHTWSSGYDAARWLKMSSGEGASPIRTLVVGGHHGHGDTAIWGSSKVLSASFRAADLLAVATVKADGDQEYETASRWIGPPKCWFAPGSDVWGVACHTSNTWMPDWAGTIMRLGSTVHGTTHYTWSAGVATLGWRRDRNGSTYEARGFWNGMKRWSMWVSMGGTR